MFEYAGSSSGIGKAVALAFATQRAVNDKKATKICVMSRSTTKLQSVVAEIEELGAQGYAVAGDLTESSDCQEAVEEAVSSILMLTLSANSACCFELMGTKCLLRWVSWAGLMFW